ncbi:MAG: hypothetical protein J6S23_05215 [Clostridia bacterium]|nr:hypothetical protein [Clostridia bacterium]
MKNTNLKLNKTKLVARLMLVVIMVVSVINLSSCNINFPWTQRGWYDASQHFDTFKAAEEYINNSPRDGNTFILFDLDDEKCVQETVYQINALGTVKNKKLVYSWGILRGTFYATKDTEESKFRIDYQFRMWGIDISDDTEFEIKLLDNTRDIAELLDIYPNRLGVQTYQCGVSYGLWVDGEIIMEIVFSGPLLEDGSYEEYYSDVCDILLENLVVIK